MNQLYTPNRHSVIASDVEMCRSTPPQLCLNPCLLNRVRVSKPQAEHKTMSVGKCRQTNTHIHACKYRPLPPKRAYFFYFWLERPNSAGEPKLGGSAQTHRYPHCEVMLSGRTSHSRVESISFFCPGLDLSGGYCDLAYVMICNTLVLWGWSDINPGVSSGRTSNSTILPQGYRTGPGHDLAEIALPWHPTSFMCPSRRWGRGEPGELAT